MRIEQYLTFTDHALWEVIVNGDSVLLVASASAGVESHIPPKTAKQKLAKKNELKAKSTLMLAILDEHLLKFHACKDAKCMNLRSKAKVAFVSSDNSSSTNETVNTAYSIYVASSKDQASTASYADDVMFSFFYNQSNASQLDNEDLKQIDTDDLKEMDLKRQVAMLTMRVKRRGHFARECRAPRNQGNRNGDAPTRNAPVDRSTTNALVVQDGICGYDWSFQAEEELINFALMAYTSQGSSSSDSKVYTCSKDCLKSYETLQKQYDQQREALNKSNLEIIDIAFLKYDVQEKDISIKEIKNQLENALKEKDDLKLKLEKFETSSKNLTKLINSQISAINKTGLGYDGQMNRSDLNDIHVNESEVLNNVVDSCESDGDDNLVNDRAEISFVGLDNSVFKSKVSETINSVPKIETNASKTSKDSMEKPKTVRPSVPLIKKWESDSEDENVFKPKEVKKTIKPSLEKIEFVNAGDTTVKNENKAEKPRKFSQSPRAAVLTKSGQVPVNAAKQSSHKATTSVSAARRVNTAAYKPNVNNALPKTYSYFKAYSSVRRPFNKKSAAKTNNFNKKVNTAKVNYVTTAGPKAVVRAVEGNRSNVVKSSACWIWRPKRNLIDHISKASRSYTLKRFNYVDLQGRLKSKNNVLFTGTECVVLSPDFKFLDESQVLLKVPRNNNMYSFDLKNVVPVGGLTCLFAKATLDESSLWHIRLGHINFKTMNKLLRGNLARGLTSKIFENDHTCVACQKGKQHKASCIENQIYHKVKTIRCDNETEFKNRIMNEFYEMKGIRREFSVAMTPQQNVNTACNVQNMVLVIKPHNKTPYELFQGYSINSKAFRLFNTRTRIVEENLHIIFFENKPNVTGTGPNWMFDIDTLTMFMNYQPVFAGNQTNGPKSLEDEVVDDAGMKSQMEAANTNSTNILNTVGLPVNVVSSSVTTVDPGRERAQRNEFESMFRQDKDANGNKMFSHVSATGSTYVNLGGSIPVNDATLPNADLHTDPLMPDLEDTADLQDTRIFSGAYDDEVKGFIVYQMNVKSAFLYITIEKEVYVCQPLGFEDLHFPNKVYKIEKALYGLHQALRAWHETLSTYLLENRFRRWIIDKTLFIKKDKEFEGLMHRKFQIAHFLLRVVGQPKLGLWYHKDSPFDLEDFSDCDYAGSSLDRKSTTGGCQFLGKRLISWQCKKQTVVANSRTKSKYVVAVNCYGQMALVMNLELKLVVADVNTANQKFVLNGCLDWNETAANDEIQSKLILSRSKWIVLCFLGFGLTFAGSAKQYVYTSCIEQFWATAKVKNVNREAQIQALVDKKKVIITEASIRRDLRFNDKGGVNYLSNEVIFEQLTLMGEVPNEEGVPITSNDPLPSGEDRIQLNKLMILCINLQKQVLDLEKAKTAQAKEIAGLKKRVKKLEQKRKSRTSGPKRLRKVGSARRVESSNKASLGRMNEENMFEVNDLVGDEVVVDVSASEKVEHSVKVVKTEVSTVDPVTTAGEVVTTADIEVKTAAKTLQISKDELTLAQTLIEIKAAKPKAIITAATIVTTASTRLKEKRIVMQEPSETPSPKPIISSQKLLGYIIPQVVSAAKLPILNPNEFDLWKMRIEQYFLMTDYSLWEVILNDDSPAPTRVIEGVFQPVAPTTVE
nr:ribonuclease H-like domain-containing protein [Tanacetum cinerariifolium]